MIQYLSADDIRQIHAEAIERYGGVPGEHEPGAIEFMAQKPKMEIYGSELYPGLFLKAAVYLEGFATRQFFVDGNKRTAFLCAWTFLYVNGFHLVVDQDDGYAFCMRVANGQAGLEEIAEWLHEHSHSLPV
ncbi:MAG: type II toxin-antitoxin system death-on-curing family toxin [Alicyclobacillus macrosporangiidus]|uniref:type II toxin-antitoxin system death-on-curing family toxin n=1 Tax=Alicyclobacillus macrosporangiidus TaxID=392015 RepID=UPI0026EDBEBC|nr:type II toxin-antitoxin system death-on-curing family toxin [Alicyclobacillus macrosporangiidus]MCL6600840.1 type II toxin-antitoxin system death-on-curing family toxin [Alicyclobacillus macrosporangiidus]